MYVVEYLIFTRVKKNITQYIIFSYKYIYYNSHCFIFYLDGVRGGHWHWHLDWNRDWIWLLDGNLDRLGMDHWVRLWHRNRYRNRVRNSDWDLRETKIQNLYSMFFI